MFSFYSCGKNGQADTGLPVSLGGGYPCRPRILILNTGIDFIDFHGYDANGVGTLQQQLDSSEYNYWQHNKITYMAGEYGACKNKYSSASAAGYPMRTWRDTLKNTYHFRGCIFWYWDDPNSRTADGGYWNLTDNSGILNSYLCPTQYSF
jgi:hypothetical protein